VKIREWLSATIQVGSGAVYSRVIEREGFAVFSKKLPSGRLSWLIARRPHRFNPSDPPPPASVTEEFESERSAIKALDRWASAPVQPANPRKPRPPRSRTEAPHRRSRKVGAAQLFLNL
jgi:hypothetical protein